MPLKLTTSVLATQIAEERGKGQLFRAGVYAGLRARADSIWELPPVGAEATQYDQGWLAGYAHVG